MSRAFEVSYTPFELDNVRAHALDKAITERHRVCCRKRWHCLTKLGLTAKDTDTIGLATQLEFFERLLAERSVDPEVRFGRRARAPAFEAERPTAVY